MDCKSSRILGLLAIILSNCLARHAAADDRPAPLVEQYLIAGNLTNGDAALEKRLQEQPKDDEARFGLGVLRFTRAVEHLAQSLYHHGLKSRDQAEFWPVPILRMPIPQNPMPARLSYTESRKIVQTVVDDLARVEATLSEVRAADVKLPLHLGRVKLDLDGNGEADEQETLWRLFARLNRTGVPQSVAERFVIAFDKADVSWLRGYCHLLSALCETVLAYDTRELFEHTAHLFFADVESPYPFLKTGRRVFEFGDVDVADVVAFIHLVNFPLSEPQRMQTALRHWEAVIALSRQSWQDLLAETDDDHEWIPNPRQTSVIPGVRVSQQMVDGWQEFLTEAEAILEGKKLVPFWRGTEPHGVNLRRVFTEPRAFDLVLWVQGTAAAPYLEAGPLSTPDVWRRFNRLFNGEFIGFAVWFN